MPHTRIGVLALQGAFALHQAHIQSLGAEYVEVVRPQDFSMIDGLILPGGESGVMLKLIEAIGIHKQLHECLSRKPSWGICAGAILMAKRVFNPEQHSFGIIDIEIERNAYGRQLNSKEEIIDDYRVSYIRAPRISKVSKDIEVLAQRNGFATWLRSGTSMITTFHPEINLAYPSPWHRTFVELCANERV